MSHLDVATEIRDAKEQVFVVYAFNATGKTRLSVAYKDLTKEESGSHTGVYYNAYSEDIFIWQNDSSNEGSRIQLDIRKSSLNKFHASLSEDDIREKLNRYQPSYRFEFINYENPEDGIQAILFFYEEADADDPNNISKIPIKVSRGEERIFVWCFFLALFDVEGWADKQSSHFFIDDPVSSLDDHNIFITASTMFDLIEENFEKRKLIITTHHIGFFAILADWLTKGEKASKFKKQAKVCMLSTKDGEISLEKSTSDVFLYHLRLLQLLEQAQASNQVKSFHFALLRQALENIASFLGVAQFGYVLQQIGIDDDRKSANIINTLSHKKVYYFESDELTSDSREMFDEVFNKLKEKYNFVLHAPKQVAA